MTYEPLKAPGVAYDLDSIQLSDSHVWKDEMGDPADVWEGSFEFRIKIALAADVAPGTKVGMAFTYNGCIENVGCYPPVVGQRAFVAIGSPSAAPQLSSPAEREEGGVHFEIDEAKGELLITFQPQFGWHFYGPDDESGASQVAVEPVMAKGVEWGEVKLPAAGEIEGAYKVHLAFQREPGVPEIAVKVKWAGCRSGAFGTCNPPREELLRVVWGGGHLTPEPVAEAVPEGEVLFDVVENDDIAGSRDTGMMARLLAGNPFVAFGSIFLIGLLLAFTPCVLPIIPITVSVITGGNADIPKGRLAGLLLTYVIGLSLAFATMGVVAALAGGSMSAAFENAGVQWAIALVFLVLAFGMLGVYELQPPAFLMKLQGGAQRRSGSFIGAFLFGCLGAIIASPCTGPAIAGLLLAVAQSGNAVQGFLLFLTLGLGMGAVFFAAGSLNFVMRPGPWMVWVRYGFGAVLVGAAFYYLGSGQLISESTLYVGGLIVAILALFGVAWHLQHKEGEQPRQARWRGLQVAVLLVGVTALVGFLTHRSENLLKWTYVRDTDHLVKLVEEANAQGKPVVVDFWAKWCHFCNEYDELIAGNPSLRKRFEQVARIKVDLTKDSKRWDLRHAVGLKLQAQPYMVFIDRKGRIRRNADVVEWMGAKEGPQQLKARLDLILGDKPVKTTAN